MGQNGKAANPSQKTPALFIDAIALASGGKRSINQIQKLINALEKFLGLTQTKYSNKARYPGEGPNNICLGCGLYIDEATHFCPEGTDHKYKIPGKCGIKPELIQLSILTRLLKAAVQHITCGYATTKELGQALQEFKEAPQPALTPADNQWGNVCPFCHRPRPDGDLCDCPQSVAAQTAAT